MITESARERRRFSKVGEQEHGVAHARCPVVTTALEAAAEASGHGEGALPRRDTLTHAATRHLAAPMTGVAWPEAGRMPQVCSVRLPPAWPARPHAPRTGCAGHKVGREGGLELYPRTRPFHGKSNTGGILFHSGLQQTNGTNPLPHVTTGTHNAILSD